MGDKPRLSISSSIGLKGVTANAAHFKQMFHQQSPSSLSKYLLSVIDFSLFALFL